MPNWKQQEACDWLDDIRPVSAADEWPPPVRPIETTGEAPQLLEDIGEALDAICLADPETMATALRSAPLQQQLRAILAQLGAARTLRLIHWLSEQDVPATHLIIASLANGDSPNARALRATITTVTRRSTLRRTFAPERLTALHAAATAALSTKETV